MANGTTIRFDDVLSDVRLIYKQYGQCVQDGTPSPANPIPITGKAAGASVYRKNLAHDVVVKDWISDTGVVSHTTGAGVLSSLQPIPGKIITLSRSANDNYPPRYIIVALFDSNDNFITRLISESGQASKTFDLTNYSTAVKFRYGFSTTLTIMMPDDAYSLLQLQLEIGSTATEYEPYVAPITQTVTDSNGDSVTLYGIPVASGGNVTIDGQQYIADTLTGNTVTRRVEHIASYNGETITTAYISSTGELSTGADVYYVLNTPVAETVTVSPATLTANSPTTTWISEAYSEVTMQSPQLVVSGNRVLAHGWDCFISMGGTVICESTGRAYQNATVVTSCDNLPSDIDDVGYEYIEGQFYPCAPYGRGTGKILVSCDECGSPKYSDYNVEGVLGAQIIVTAETGSTVRCIKDDVEVYATENNGVWTFYPKSYGTWTITAELEDREAETNIIVDIVKQYNINLPYFEATIATTYPEGSTCTCTCGDTTYTAPDTSGSYTFTVEFAGTWVVSATDGENTDSKNVIITTIYQEETIELSYMLWLYKSGSATTDGWGAYPYAVSGAGGSRLAPTLTIEDGCLKISLVTAGWTDGTAFYDNIINFAEFSTLTIDVDTSTVTSASQLYVGISSNKVQGYTSILRQAITTGSNRTITLDVSALTVSGYVYFMLLSESGSSTIKINNIKLMRSDV